jgi:hypothetical protein
LFLGKEIGERNKKAIEGGWIGQERNQQKRKYARAR